MTKVEIKNIDEAKRILDVFHVDYIEEDENSLVFPRKESFVDAKHALEGMDFYISENNNTLSM